jgi:hypothetical protein
MDFEPGDHAVTLNDIACGNVTVVSDTEITCDTGATTACDAGDVVVANANGTATIGGGFRYGPGPLFIADGRARVNGSLQKVNVCTNAVTPIGPIGAPLTGLDVMDGVLYGSQTNQFFGGIMNLYSINKTTGAGTVVGALSTATGTNHPHVTDLTHVGTQLYGWSRTGNVLVSINSTTGQVTPFAFSTSTYGGALAANAAGTMYAALGGACGQLTTVNTTTGATTFAATLNGGGCNAIMAMTFHEGELWAIRKESPGTSLIKINTTTGAITLVGTTGMLPQPIDSIASETP